MSVFVNTPRQFLTFMSATKKQRILQLLTETSVLRPRDLEAIGISGVYLNKLFAEGLLERPSRGLYTLANSEPSEHRTIAEASKRVPQGIVCLLNALVMRPYLEAVTGIGAALGTCRTST